MPISPVVAVFDFDHTITDRDSLIPFLFFCKGSGASMTRLLTLIPDFCGFLSGWLSRQTIKEKIITRFFSGERYTFLEEQGKKYADQQLDRYIKPEALQRLLWHQSQGHRCLLVSASLEFYLHPWAMRYGFEAVLASRLALTPTGLITGQLEGLNCWGPEKLRRLLAYLGPRNTYQLYVYGDSKGDQQILAAADYPFYRTFK